MARPVQLTPYTHYSARREGKPSSEGEGPVELSADVLAAIASLKKVALHMGTFCVAGERVDG